MLEAFDISNTQLGDMFAVRDRYWGSREVPSAVYTFHGNYSSETTQTQFSRMTTALDSNDMLVPDSCVNWWPAFVDFAETNASAAMRTVDGERIVEAASFDDTLLNFYGDDAGAVYASQLKLASDSTLRLSKILCVDDADKNDMIYRTEQMDRMREIAAICSSVGAVAFGPQYWIQGA